MATAQKIWTFNAGAESWSFTASTNDTGTAQNARLEHDNEVGRNKSNAGHWSITGTFASIFGIATNATVTGYSNAYFNGICHSYSGTIDLCLHGDTATGIALEINDGTSRSLVASQSTYTAASQTRTPNVDPGISGLSLAATTSITIYAHGQLDNGNDKAAFCGIAWDEIGISIEYTAPATVTGNATISQAVSTALSSALGFYETASLSLNTSISDTLSVLYGGNLVLAKNLIDSETVQATLNVATALSKILSQTDTSFFRKLTAVRVGFESPGSNIDTSTNAQTFEALVRRDAANVGQAGTPTVDLELWINGVFSSTVASGVAVTSDTGQLITQTFTSPTESGLNVELRIVGHPDNYRQVEVGGMHWIAALSELGTFNAYTVLSVDLSIPITTQATMTVLSILSSTYSPSILGTLVSNVLLNLDNNISITTAANIITSVLMDLSADFTLSDAASLLTSAVININKDLSITEVANLVTTKLITLSKSLAINTDVGAAIISVFVALNKDFTVVESAQLITSVLLTFGKNFTFTDTANFITAALVALNKDLSISSVSEIVILGFITLNKSFSISSAVVAIFNTLSALNIDITPQVYTEAILNVTTLLSKDFTIQKIANLVFTRQVAMSLNLTVEELVQSIFTEAVNLSTNYTLEQIGGLLQIATIALAFSYASGGGGTEQRTINLYPTADSFNNIFSTTPVWSAIDDDPTTGQPDADPASTNTDDTTGGAGTTVYIPAGTLSAPDLWPGTFDTLTLQFYTVGQGSGNDTITYSVLITITGNNSYTGSTRTLGQYTAGTWSSTGLYNTQETTNQNFDFANDDLNFQINSSNYSKQASPDGMYLDLHAMRLVGEYTVTIPGGGIVVTGEFFAGAYAALALAYNLSVENAVQFIGTVLTPISQDLSVANVASLTYTVISQLDQNLTLTAATENVFNVITALNMNLTVEEIANAVYYVANNIDSDYSIIDIANIITSVSSNLASDYSLLSVTANIFNVLAALNIDITLETATSLFKTIVASVALNTDYSIQEQAQLIANVATIISLNLSEENIGTFITTVLTDIVSDYTLVSNTFNVIIESIALSKDFSATALAEVIAGGLLALSTNYSITEIANIITSALTEISANLSVEPSTILNTTAQILLNSDQTITLTNIGGIIVSLVLTKAISDLTFAQADFAAEFNTTLAVGLLTDYLADKEAAISLAYSIFANTNATKTLLAALNLIFSESLATNVANIIFDTNVSLSQTHNIDASALQTALASIVLQIDESIINDVTASFQAAINLASQVDNVSFATLTLEGDVTISQNLVDVLESTGILNADISIENIVSLALVKNILTTVDVDISNVFTLLTSKGFDIFVETPGKRTMIIKFENRTFAIHYEDRTIVPPDEDRG